MRWICVDYGTKRIGLALGDDQTRIAGPAAMIHAAGSIAQDAARIVEFARRQDAGAIVVGLPLNMDGTHGTQARYSKMLADRLREAGCARVELWDERLSSFQADEWSRERGDSHVDRKQSRDALAAQAILQSFLDAGAAPPRETN